MLDRTPETVIQNLEVIRQDSVYVVSGQVGLQASLEAVRARLLDFNHLDRLHHSIQTSELQRRFPDGRHRVRVQVQFQLLRFGFTLQSIQDFTWNERTIYAVMLPEKSDFARGEIQWELTPRKEETQLRFRAELTPALWLPPFVGPYLLQRILPEKACEIVQNLERLAAP